METPLSFDSLVEMKSSSKLISEEDVVPFNVFCAHVK